MSSESARSKAELVKKESASLLADLAQMGFVVDWVSDLYTKKLNYRKAIPVLLDWLPRIENIDVKESLVRALSIPSAKSIAALPLIEEFKKARPESSSLKWAIGNALSIVADDNVYEDVSRLAQDRQHGKAREMLVLALGNMKNSQAQDILIDLLNDNEVCGHAIMALGKLGSSKAYPEIEKFLENPKAWVRKESKKALLKIEKGRT